MDIVITISIPDGVEAKVGASAEPAEKPEVQEPAVRHRGRRRMKPADTTPPPAEPPVEKPAEEEPAKPARRRGRPLKGEAKADEKKAEPDKAEEKPKRQRRGSKAKKDEGITDADLVKACSTAAETTGPEPIKEMLDEFGVENTKDIAQEDRQEFLDTLDEEVAAWKAEAEAENDGDD